VKRHKTFYVLLACLIGGFALTVAVYYALLALVALVAHLSINT
jgi:hypothetical protein